MSIEELKKHLDVVQQVVNMALKLAVAIGAMAILVYCGTIGYYPHGIAIGDGLFFIWIALSFGFTYTLLAFFLLCAGIALLPILRPLRWTALKAIAAWGKIARKDSTLTLPPIATVTSTYAPIAVVGVISLLLLILASYSNPRTGLTLLASAALMGFGFSALVDMSRPDKGLEGQTAEASTNNFGRAQLILATALYLIPFLLGGVLGNVLAQSFRMAGIRHEGVTLYVDKDFFEVMKPTYSPGRDDETVGGFKKMEGVDVLFTGVGSSSVIRVSVGRRARRFIVPNDKFHIEY